MSSLLGPHVGIASANVRALLVLVPIASGCALVVNPGADRSMAPVVEGSIASVRERSVAARARRIEVPDLTDPTRVRDGARSYDALCAVCHGTPEGARSELARGLQPPPPSLAKMEVHDPRVTFWTIKHGIKMTAMPAWGLSLDDEKLWSLTAFVQTLPSLSPEAYAELIGRGRAPDHEHGGHGSTPSHGEHAESGHERHGTAMTLLERMEMRNASGTSWQPESTPMTALHAETDAVRWMGHGNFFGIYDVQGSPRGDTQLLSMNWVMLHGTIGDDDSELGARAMLSLEPLTIGGAGYPLLGQTGETWEGQRLVDRQHPHDLFMELALQARQTFGDVAGFELYAAPAGEPALGPTAFPHRASAISDPFAPIGHHWEDATHISFGVLTAGVFNEWAKLEGSWFNGREPDEDRYDLDLRVPDSWSSRLSVSLMPTWTAQVSYGWLDEPEPVLEPGVSVARITASTTFDHDAMGNGNWAVTAAWGRNTSHGEASDALLLETDLGVGNNNVFARAEHVLKSLEELEVSGTGSAALTSLSVGDVYSLAVDSLRIGVGVRGNVLLLPRTLEDAYGGSAAFGGAVYVQARPGEAKRHGSRGSGHSHGAE